MFLYILNGSCRRLTQVPVLSQFDYKFFQLLRAVDRFVAGVFNAGDYPTFIVIAIDDTRIRVVGEEG